MENNENKTNVEPTTIITAQGIADLNDTVKLMNSENYIDRFKAEYLQLKIRINKLHKMLIKYEAGTLDFTPTCPILVLQNQLNYMNQYLKVLEIRAEQEKIEL